jgi:hypothetical protein
LFPCRHASAHPGRFVHVESGPGRLELTPWKVWAWGGTCSPCATADQKQGAQPSASPFAPALLTHFDFDSKRLCFAIEDAQFGESGLGRGEYKRRLPFTRRSVLTKQKHSSQSPPYTLHYLSHTPVLNILLCLSTLVVDALCPTIPNLWLKHCDTRIQRESPRIVLPNQHTFSHIDTSVGAV